MKNSNSVSLVLNGVTVTINGNSKEDVLSMVRSLTGDIKKTKSSERPARAVQTSTKSESRKSKQTSKKSESKPNAFVEDRLAKASYLVTDLTGKKHGFMKFKSAKAFVVEQFQSIGITELDTLVNGKPNTLQSFMKVHDNWSAVKSVVYQSKDKKNRIEIVAQKNTKQA